MYLCPLATCHESKQSSDGIVLSHRREGFVIVFPPSLGKPFGTEAGFIATVVLDSEYPTRFDYFRVCGPRYQSPDIILDKGFVLSEDSLLPLSGILPIHGVSIIGWPNRCDIGPNHLDCHPSEVSPLSTVQPRFCIECINIGSFCGYERRSSV